MGIPEILHAKILFSMCSLILKKELGEALWAKKIK